MRHMAFAIAWCGVVSAIAPTVRAEGITCRIEQEVVQEFADTVFPLDLNGKKRLSVVVLGASVKQDVPWKATVSDPVISIEKDAQTFTADIDVEAVATTWRGKVHGRLVIDYDEEQNAVVVQVTDAVVPVSVGPITMEVDVSKEIPDLPLHVTVPDLAIPFRGKTIRMQATPSIECEEGAVVVKTDVVFKKK